MKVIETGRPEQIAFRTDGFPFHTWTPYRCADEPRLAAKLTLIYRSRRRGAGRERNRKASLFLRWIETYALLKKTATYDRGIGMTVRRPVCSEAESRLEKERRKKKSRNSAFTQTRHSQNQPSDCCIDNSFVTVSYGICKHVRLLGGTLVRTQESYIFQSHLVSKVSINGIYVPFCFWWKCREL